ncbi:hypothetical protein M422DRAFT_214674 [Sphaerobolus stellatus SS14]|uniref:Unplaced genomic scaffold SPHSTscaffold_192, whole genome shotgun sequence n=1 Tax=Sphaerobolus stellatus (strain SS14) TaxID=990650 RepID=A0A0C9U759_SPHS4|nr:hypothetical protein M422DRAFT_214674 [Sphaerobolus stellatus SS14]
MDDGLRDLANRIQNSLLVETSEHQEQELYYDLERNRERLLKLFDIGPRSSTEAKDVENRKYTFNGRQHDLHVDLIKPVLFMAEQLDCSEYYCAALFARTQRRQPNIDLPTLVEQVIRAYHAERQTVLDCLNAILRGCEPSPTSSPSLRNVFQKFAKELIVHVVPLESSRRGRFPQKMLVEIEKSAAATVKLTNSLTNATSTTNALGGQGHQGLSYDLIQLRISHLRRERRELGFLLYTITTLRLLSGVEITAMAERLADKPQDDMSYYLLTTVLRSLVFPDPTVLTFAQATPLYNDRTFSGNFGKLLDDKARWKSPALRAILALQWSILIWAARHRDPELVNAPSLPPGFSDEEVEKRVWEAVQSDVFPLLLDITQNVRPRGAIAEADRSLTGLGVRLNSETDVDPDIVAEDFKMPILWEFEQLVTSFISSMSSVIRRIKHRQEDVGLASSRANRPTGGRNEEAPVATRNDVAQLFEFIGVLYTCLPEDCGLKFWVTSTDPREGKLFAFLRWATESQDRILVSAAYDMLAGIAKGRASAEVAYNFLISGNSGDRGYGGILAGGGNMFSWATLFRALSWWAEALPNPGQHRHEGPNVSGRWQQPTLSDPEALMLGAFLRLLRVVIKHAPAARLAVYTMPDFRVIPILLALLQHGIQLELKGVILDTLAAFCESGAGVQGVEICKNVWAALERAELINLRAGALATRGVENELEGVETPAQRYPATIPFLRLLSALIHTPKDLQPQQMVVEYEPIDTIPEGLGQPTRLGGIGPYVRFVVDNVLLRAKDREFMDSSDKWKMVEGALCFVERCLASYNLRSLLSLTEESLSKNPEILRSYHTHPGFELLLQLLTDTPLRTEITDYISQGVEALESGNIKNVYFERVLLRVLRIVLCVLETQDLFTEMLLPLLVQIEGSSGSLNFLASSIIPFDQMLNWAPHLIIKIALCTAYAGMDESKLLAVKILSVLSESPVFSAVEQGAANNKQRLNRLALIFDRSEYSHVISDSFVGLLGQYASEEDSPSMEAVDLSTGAGAAHAPSPLYLTYGIRQIILQLMLQNTTQDKPAPNIAHALLGFYPDPSHPNQLAIQDPHAADSRRTCLHVILDLLNTGVPRTGTDIPMGGMLTFMITHPMLAEQCYRLMYQLCTHRTTSDVVMRYLRTREDFFARHLSALPFQVPHINGPGSGYAVYGDGTRVKTDSAALLSFLRIRALVLKTIALELHTLTEMGQSQRTSRLLALLFANTAPFEQDQGLLEGLLNPFTPGQSLIRIIELFQSLDLEWRADTETEEGIQLKYFNTLDVSSCLGTDENGCEIFDVNALLSQMYQHRRQIQAQAVAVTPQVQDELRNEMKYVFSTCSIENTRRQVQHGRGIGYESWKELLDISLAKGFHRLPQERRESILFDLLQILPPTIQSASIQPHTAVALSEVMLTLVTKLRGDRQQQLILQSTFDDSYAASLPVDRLKVLLKDLIECLASSGRVELIRGNLYAALVNYLHLVEEARERSANENLTSEGGLLSASFSKSPSLSESSSEDSFSSFSTRRPQPRRSELEASTLSIINKDVDGLVALISTDAIDGLEVWKTISFALLDSLVALSRLERSHKVLSVLSRRGYLQNFVQGIKGSDVQLQEVLRPDPDSLNSLYVYEAKMAILIRIAQTHTGTEKLLESRLIHVLSQCDFIEARPEADQSFLDYDSFLPSAVHRYHQLVLPALELVNSMVATLGPTSQASKQAAQFILSHRETFLILLRESTAMPTLQQIREIHLLISICSYVVSLVEPSDLRNPASGIGGIHAAILSLAAKWLPSQRHIRIHPANDTERDEAAARASGYGHQRSIFDARVEEAIDLLHEAMCMYLEASSESNVEREFVPVLTPVGVSNRPEEHNSQINAPAPTISDSIEALAQVLNELGKVLSEVADISSKLSSKDHIEVDEIDEIAKVSGAEYTEDLNMMQRRLLAYRELERARQTNVNIVLRKLHSLEVLLLLIWRHINYCTVSATSSLGQSASVAPRNERLAMSWLGMRSTLREDELSALLDHVRRSIRPILDRLEGIQLPQDIVGLDHRSREGYIEMICRLIATAVSEDRENDQSRSVRDDVQGLGSW